MICAQITDGSAVCPWSAFGRTLPVVTMACAAQVECERLVSGFANGRSIAMPLRNLSTHDHFPKRKTTTAIPSEGRAIESTTAPFATAPQNLSV